MLLAKALIAPLALSRPGAASAIAGAISLLLPFICNAAMVLFLTLVLAWTDALPCIIMVQLQDDASWTTLRTMNALGALSMPFPDAINIGLSYLKMLDLHSKLHLQECISSPGMGVDAS